MYGYVFILYICLFVYAFFGKIYRGQCAALFFPKPIEIEIQVQPQMQGRFFLCRSQTPASYAKMPWHCSITISSYRSSPGSCHDAKYVCTIYIYKNRRLIGCCDGGIKLRHMSIQDLFRNQRPSDEESEGGEITIHLIY